MLPPDHYALAEPTITGHTFCQSNASPANPSRGKRVAGEARCTLLCLHAQPLLNEGNNMRIKCRGDYTSSPSSEYRKYDHVKGPFSRSYVWLRAGFEKTRYSIPGGVYSAFVSTFSIRLAARRRDATTYDANDLSH